MTSLLLLQCLTASLAVLAIHTIIHKCNRQKLPPGPSGIAGITALPRQGVPEFQHWLTHRAKYGPISSVRVLGQTLIILQDKKAAAYILGKQSIKTSGRPQTVFGHQLCGFDQFFIVQPFNDSFRRRRKLVHQQLGTKAATSRFDDIQEIESRRLLLRIFEDPSNIFKHFRTEAGAIILKLTYGYSVRHNGADPLVDLIEKVVQNFGEALVPMAWLVDVIPALRYLPHWLPGMRFKRVAQEWNQLNQDSVNIPYLFTKSQIADGDFQSSLVSRAIGELSGNYQAPTPLSLSQSDEDDIKWTAATLYGAGADTTVSSLTSFVLAMLMFPQVQRKAQEEIDCVIEDGRLPQFQDRINLPYTNSIVSEVLRWAPVGPMGMPHLCGQDMEYEGYHIPQGSIIISSIWWFCHDPEVYADPESFEPERYLAPRSEPDPREVVFGFGRRVCPGQHLADSNLFVTIAQMLAVFHFGKALDEYGKEIPVKLEHTPGIISHPEKFSYTVVPRSSERAELVCGMDL